MWRQIRQRLSPLFETPHGTRRQIPPIEGLRGFATLLVFLVHYATLIEGWLAPYGATQQVATALHAVGPSGVDLFFVLSGYLIYGGLIARHVTLGNYLRRRFRRIYPTFLAVLMLYVTASWIVPSHSKLPEEAIPTAVFLVANVLLLPGMFPLQPLITVAWSLSYEMFFYLMSPLLIEGLYLRHWSAAFRSLLFLGIAAALLALAPIIESRTRLAMFLAGMLLVETRWLVPVKASGPEREPVPAVLPSTVAVLAVGLAMTIGYFVETRELGAAAWTGAFFPAFFFLCLATFQEKSALWRLFSWTPLRWFGNMSYSFFLLHGLTLNVLFFCLERFAPPVAAWDGMFWALLLPAFCLCLLPTGVLFLLIERPFSLAPSKA